MKDLIIIGIIALIVVFAAAYVIRKKKQGVKCIGCPYANDCSQKTESGCSCTTK